MIFLPGDRPRDRIQSPIRPASSRKTLGSPHEGSVRDSQPRPNASALDPEQTMWKFRRSRRSTADNSRGRSRALYRLREKSALALVRSRLNALIENLAELTRSVPTKFADTVFNFFLEPKRKKTAPAACATTTSPHNGLASYRRPWRELRHAARSRNALPVVSSGPSMPRSYFPRCRLRCFLHFPTRRHGTTPQLGAQLKEAAGPQNRWHPTPK